MFLVDTQRSLCSTGLHSAKRQKRCNGHARHLGPHPRKLTCSRRSPASRPSFVTAAASSFYEVLQVPKDADTKTIKKAFKKMALKYHPDVNNEPGAKDKFMECKTAYQTLVDSSQRQQYDRTLQGGSGGIDWNAVGDAFKRGTGTTTSQPKRPKTEEEEFYGFGDFFRDLEKSAASGLGMIQNAFRDLDNDFQKRRARVTEQPQSLWQELYDVGEEFVEFLEQEIGMKGKKGQPSSGASKSAPASEPEKQQLDAEARLRKAEQEEAERKRQAEQEIEDMMAELKGKLKSKDS